MPWPGTAGAFPSRCATFSRAGLQRDRSDPALLGAEQGARLLARNPLFSGLAPAQLAPLANTCRVVRFGAGETVLRQGELGDTLYQVVEGQLAVDLEGSDGPPRRLAELATGAVFGEMGLFAGEPRSATVRALDACLLLEVHRPRPDAAAGGRTGPGGALCGPDRGAPSRQPAADANGSGTRQPGPRPSRPDPPAAPTGGRRLSAPR
jgi:hypothetical protein